MNNPRHATYLILQQCPHCRPNNTDLAAPCWHRINKIPIQQSLQDTGKTINGEPPQSPPMQDIPQLRTRIVPIKYRKALSYFHEIITSRLHTRSLTQPPGSTPKISIQCIASIATDTLIHQAKVPLMEKSKTSHDERVGKEDKEVQCMKAKTK